MDGKKSGAIAPKQKLRYGLKRSTTRLIGLLRANFQDGAQLVTLTYGDGPVYSSFMAECQLVNWIQSAMEKQGQRLAYIRATDSMDGKHGPVHRVVLGVSGVSAAVLADLWRYGPAVAEPVLEGHEAEVAALLLTPAMAMVRSNPWSASRGLSRPKKEVADHGVLATRG